MKNLNIEDYKLLEATIGTAPTFHDSEIVRIVLESRAEEETVPTLSAIIRVAVYAGEQSETGKSKYDKYNVHLSFADIFGLRLENFNHQNVLEDLIISKFDGEVPAKLLQDIRLRGFIVPQTIEDIRFHVKFAYCFGVEADFFCTSIKVVSVNPA